jgi:hypothetical protein
MPQYEDEVEEAVEDDILPQNIHTAYLLRADELYSAAQLDEGEVLMVQPDGCCLATGRL